MVNRRSTTRLSASAKKADTDKNLDESTNEEQLNKSTPTRSSRGAGATPKAVRKEIVYQEIEMTSDSEDENENPEEPKAKDKMAKTNTSNKKGSDESGEEEVKNGMSDSVGDKTITNGTPKSKPGTPAAHKRKSGTPAANKIKSGLASANKSASKRNEPTESDEEFEDESEDYEDYDSDESGEEDEGQSEDISEGEDENPVVPLPVDYKSEEWLDKVSKMCQKCEKTYDSCRDASNCLTMTHRRIRCYLCYTFHRSTEMLFLHYDATHKLATVKRDTLLCTFCSQSLPYKSVSCHVITSHIATREPQLEGVYESDGGKENSHRRKKKNKRARREDSDEEEDEDEDEPEESEEEEEEAPKPKKGRASTNGQTPRGRKSAKKADSEEDQEDED